MASSPGAFIRSRRLALNLTQRELAIRAGTTQAAVSRLERGELSPTFATVDRLLECMGERLEIEAVREQGDWDPDHMRDQLRRTPQERLDLAMSWNKLAGETALAGEQERSAGSSGSAP